MNGYTLKLVSDKTGVSYDKLRQLVSRNVKLQSMPYSVKNGGTRIFFDAFVEWLKVYEGVTDVTDKSQASQPSQNGKLTKLPNGRQLAELQRIYPKDQLTARIDAIMGWAPVPEKLVNTVALMAPESRASEDEIDALMRNLREQHGIAVGKVRGIGDYVERQALERQEAKILRDQLNHKLDFNGSAS